MTSKTGIWPSLIESTAGNTLPMAAAAMLLTASLVGGSVDISRAYLVRNRMQAACDAGILAGRKAMQNGNYDDAAKATAEKYFKVNFDEANEGATDTDFTSDSVEGTSGTVAGSVSSTIDTTVMKIFGINDIDLSVECTSSLETGNNDIMMVLDTTGSMALTPAGKVPAAGETSRLQDLQAAINNFYDTLATTAANSNARIRFGFVPFSSSVNVGKLIMDVDSDYLVKSHSIQSRSWYLWGPAQMTGTGSGYTAESYSTWNRVSGITFTSASNCDTAIPKNLTWANSGSPTTPNTTTWTIDANSNRLNTTTTSNQNQVKTEYQCRSQGTKWYHYTRTAYRSFQTFSYSRQEPQFLTSASQPYDGVMYRQVTYDVSSYLGGNAVSTLTGSNAGSPSVVSSKWAGCIEERQTSPASSFSYVPGTGITPTAAYDLDIDLAPGSDDATKWKPLWPDVAFRRNTVLPATTGSTASWACPSPARLLSEMDNDSFEAYAASLVATGQTYYDIGLVWGARLSSMTGIWADNVNETPKNGGTVRRHMIFMTDGALAPNDVTLSSYGIESLDRRITAGGNLADQSKRHRSRYLALCDAIKGKGIRLWVISFATALSDDLKTCASANSAFAATDAGELNTAFQEIANQIGELRVTQ